MKVEIKETSEGKRLEKFLEDCGKDCVVVGYQEGRKKYTVVDEKGKQEEVDMVDVAMFNELGTSKIPARPFLKNSVDMYEREIGEFVDQQVGQALDNDSDAQELLKKLGAYHVGLIQRSILDGEYVPNAPYTIEKKGSSKPLVDTGQLLQSPHYIIRKDDG